jgi:ATP-binding cassette, subfamily B, bacterial
VFASVALVAQIMLGHFCHLDLARVSEVQEMRLRGELMDLVNGPPRIDHLDRPDVADNVDLVRDGLIATTRSLDGVLQLAGLLLQMVITIVLLVTVSPLFAVLPLCAVVPVLLERAAQNTVENARERTAERLRLAKHLLELATSTGPVRELRLFGAEDEILRRQRSAWDEVTTAMWRAQLKAATYRGARPRILRPRLRRRGRDGAVPGAAPACLGRRPNPCHHARGTGERAGCRHPRRAVAVAGRRAHRRPDRRATGGRVSCYRLRGLRTRGLGERHDYSRQGGPRDHLRGRLVQLPGTQRPVLSGVSMHIPAGSVLALAGENGSGKSTLVKLLCGLYQPTSGRILVDGQDLATLDPARWRSHVATLFQDFQHIELTLRESIGHGDIARAGDTAAVSAAADKARADRVLRAVPGGLNGYVGHSYTDGAELSGGQWQTVGLARTLMRQHPLLLILDEPAAALDAAAEHDLFERYTSSAGQAAREHGGITVLISHRFSTVSMADFIVVLDHGQITEFGTHRELMTNPKLYAELFTLQARTYS